MKIVIASDSFKGSLTSIEAGTAIKNAAEKVFGDAEIIVSPLADGGEGTAESLLEGLGGRIIHCSVDGPMGNKIDAQYALTDDNTAIIDIAAAAGLTLVDEEDRNPLEASTYGVGQMIDNAIRRGVRKYIIGLGGSATIDGGIGMLEALGLKFYNRFGDRIKNIKGKDVAEIKHIDFSEGNRYIPECEFSVACDVENVLCGPDGAAEVFGAQKGADEKAIKLLDTALSDLADTVKMNFHKDTKNIKGAGAAGGLGWAFVTFLGGELKKGTEIVAEATKLREKLENADIFVTGEGKIDSQSVMGKAPVSAAKIAKEAGAITIAFCAVTGDGAEAVNEEAIDAFFPILREICEKETMMQKENATLALEQSAEQVFKVINSVK